MLCFFFFINAVNFCLSIAIVKKLALIPQIIALLFQTLKPLSMGSAELLYLFFKQQSFLFWFDVKHLIVHSVFVDLILKITCSGL